MSALEQRAFNALPVARSVVADRWLARLAGGALKRANSAWTFTRAESLASLRPLMESLFAEARMPTAFRISPLLDPAIERDLESAGYRVVGACRAMVGSATTTGMAPPAATTAVRLDEALTPRWLDGFGAAADRDPTTTALSAAMIAAVALPSVYATLLVNGEAAGFGRAVIERGATGLFDIVVRREHRGRGGGRLVASALLRRGHDHGGTQAHLQVNAANATAIRLYESLGFRTAYAYHYRELAHV